MIAVWAFKVATIPALAILTVCCSIASCRADLSEVSILSNSSIAATPPFANTIAPASRFIWPVSVSLITAAVKPTAEEPLPEVYSPRGDTSIALFRISDLPVPGSPTNRR